MSLRNVRSQVAVTGMTHSRARGVGVKEIRDSEISTQWNPFYD